MKNRIIENKKLRKAMDEEGLQEYALAKGKDYFYIVSINNASEEAIRKSVDSPSIPIIAFNRQSIKEWIKDIKNSLNHSDDNWSCF